MSDACTPTRQLIVIERAAELRAFLQEKRILGSKIAFVPTMGALHAGHLSLVAQARQKGDLVVGSIFVNPTQFNDPADFEKYPATLEADIDQLEAAGCDVLFAPSVAEMYPNGLTERPHYPIGSLETVLEGAFRPGHFQGVCQVVDRLLHMVQPDVLLLGQKDLQQTLVIKKLIDIVQLPIEVVVVPTQREASGLAMSSRNMRLTDAQRAAATTIYKALTYIRTNFRHTPFATLEAQARQQLLQNGFDGVDYISIVSTNTLQPVTRWDGTTHLAVVAAATIGGVRLIDNMIITQ